LIDHPFSAKMEPGMYIPRRVEGALMHHLGRGKSILLLGPRQTGKTTLLERIEADLRLSLVTPGVRQRYERDPNQLLGEIAALGSPRRRPLVLLDEVQKVPKILDVVQAAIDERKAQFVLSGSSARKLRRGGAVNLLPGRVVSLRLDPLSLEELPTRNLEDLLLYGSLPGIWTVEKAADREVDLESYVQAYLEEEVRAEALVRDLGTFSRFLELAGLESGNIVSFRALSQEIGVSHTTIAGFYEILEDCLIAERIDPLTHSKTRKKLTRSSRHVIFDLGVRRLCAREGRRLSRDRMGHLFEQLVGVELVRLSRTRSPGTTVLFWRDPDGPEVDWLVASGDEYIPIEAKWTDAPTLRDARHLQVFVNEYPAARTAFVVCRVPRRTRIATRVEALPWQELPAILAA
jgi:predicted AAA+ superfamily ATPase